MKKQVLLTVMVTMAMMMFVRTDGFGQLLLNENFDYLTGSQLITNGWAQTGTITTNPILISNGGLSYAGYPSSGIGNAASLIPNGQDVNQVFTMQSTGTVYAGFLVSVTSAQVTGDYFLHFIQPPATSNVFKGRVWIKKDAASSNFAFGISKSATAAASIAYTGFTYSLNTTYLIVLKYQFNSGTTTDDNVSIYINPDITAPEPAVPTLSYIDNTQTDATNIGFIALRQGGTTSSAALQADGIRIGLSWTEVTGYIAPIPTLSEWGLIILGMALLGFGTFYILRMKG